MLCFLNYHNKKKMAAGQLDQAGQLQLRQQMAFHNVITGTMKTRPIDIAFACAFGAALGLLLAAFI